ncbi:ABC transporter permease [Staphylococcus simulans]|uniref:ABC transporter permease n=1 Tax=Staphylococcus simulans TaxID=1286 RepID=UPI000D09EFC7|nr:ABC transporter permease [Staphylococcus simulans]AVO03193.1 hypothetical protein BI282_12595 [Staphylococcus simulans]AVO06148.1 hypothetical protein BI283_12610 [Staphylococcus simulans]AWG19741.1 hypothetical protein A9958_12600 [Staphylococcus simulans]AWI02689.1 hypothetical protein A7X73_12490 [Staphylococcus simulans]PTJ00422.1 ABC transporter permease [Staphylococcus simulans]
MIVSQEFKKAKRTGFIPAFLVGGLLAFALPVLNTAVRSENYLGLPSTPLQILFDANWPMMAMLNVLLIVGGACLMYYTEYADNAIQKMKSLPIKESTMFVGKAVLLSVMYVIVLTIETLSFIFSSFHWFGLYNGFWLELGKNFGYFFLLGLPSIMLSLLIASAFKNMWVSLGINVIGVFMAMMIYNMNFILSLFPFAMPFQIFGGTDPDRVLQFICAAFIGVIVIGIAELIFLKVRRSFE